MNLKLKFEWRCRSGEKKKVSLKNLLKIYALHNWQSQQYGEGIHDFNIVDVQIIKTITRTIHWFFSANLSSQTVSRDKIYARQPHTFNSADSSSSVSKKGWVCVKSFKALCFLYENFQYHFGLHLNWLLKAPSVARFYITFFNLRREKKNIFVKKIENCGKLTKYLAIVDFSLFVDVLATSWWKREK